MKKIYFLIILLFGVTNNGFTQSVKIGTQEWTTKNLDVSTFRNGDPISEAKSKADWFNANWEFRPAWCYYNNDPENGAKYGKLYNWYAVNDPRGLAPKGWHIPSDSEWDVLVTYLGGDEAAGEKMKSKSGWCKDCQGNDKSGFAGLPGGVRYVNGIFDVVGGIGYWWSASEENILYALLRTLNSRLIYCVKKFNYNKGCGLSVRCLKD